MQGLPGHNRGAFLSLLQYLEFPFSAELLYFSIYVGKEKEKKGIYLTLFLHFSSNHLAVLQPGLPT